jgi:hypothetical protein
MSQQKNVPTGFPYPGTWYNFGQYLFNVSDVTSQQLLTAGEFRIYGNKTLHWQLLITKKATPFVSNPASDYFTLKKRLKFRFFLSQMVKVLILINRQDLNFQLVI